MDLESNRLEYEIDLAAAKESGLKFRVEYRSDGARFVHYLTQEEIDWYEAGAAQEQAELARKASIPIAEKLARIGLTVDDIKAALAS